MFGEPHKRINRYQQPIRRAVVIGVFAAAAVGAGPVGAVANASEPVDPSLSTGTSSEQQSPSNSADSGPVVSGTVSAGLAFAGAPNPSEPQEVILTWSNVITDDGKTAAGRSFSEYRLQRRTNGDGFPWDTISKESDPRRTEIRDRPGSEGEYLYRLIVVSVDDAGNEVFSTSQLVGVSTVPGVSNPVFSPPSEPVPVPKNTPEPASTQPPSNSAGQGGQTPNTSDGTSDVTSEPSATPSPSTPSATPGELPTDGTGQTVQPSAGSSAPVVPIQPLPGQDLSPSDPIPRPTPITPSTTPSATATPTPTETGPLVASGEVPLDNSGTGTEFEETLPYPNTEVAVVETETEVIAGEELSPSDRLVTYSEESIGRPVLIAAAAGTTLLAAAGHVGLFVAAGRRDDENE